MTQTDLLKLAKQGDSNAIATLMNRQLQPKGISVTVNTVKNCLQIIFEAAEVPPQKSLTIYAYNAISKLEVPSLEKVVICGKQNGNRFSVWQQEFNLLNNQSLSDGDELLKSNPSNASEVKVPADSNIFECSGNAVTLIVRINGIIIKRTNAFLSSHANSERFIHYNNILNLQFYNSGVMTYGFIYFQLVGSAESIKYLQAPSNQNATVFTHVKFNEFEKAKSLILEKIGLKEQQIPSVSNIESNGSDLHKAAQNGDIKAIASLIEQGFTDQVVVTPIKRSGILVLTLRFSQKVDSQVAIQVVINTLNSVKPEKIRTVQVVGTRLFTEWNKYISLISGNYVETTKSMYISMAVIMGVFGLSYFWYTLNPPTQVSSPSLPESSHPVSRTYLGTSKTGYELWVQGSCIIVKGITEADLARLNIDIYGYKKAVKLETGYSCVLFE